MSKIEMYWQKNGVPANTSESTQFSDEWEAQKQLIETIFLEGATPEEVEFLMNSTAVVSNTFTNRPAILIPLAYAAADLVQYDWLYSDATSNRTTVAKTSTNSVNVSPLAMCNQRARAYLTALERIRTNLFGNVHIQVKCTATGTTIIFDQPQLLDAGDSVEIAGGMHIVASVTEAQYEYVLNSAPVSGLNWAKYDHDFGNNRIKKNTPRNVMSYPAY